jgi:APA family basic amino acid/polyamine antiporter
VTSASVAQGRSLNRILGAGFNLALAFGATVGVGILRLPGTVAAALGDARLVILVWLVGGLYATLGALSVGELAAMNPRAGGFYVYARQAFGPRVGFVVGWNDWILNAITVAYAVLTAVDFLAALVPGAAAHPKLAACVLLALFTAVNWLGLRVGAPVQNTISTIVGLMLVGLALACFGLHPAPAAVAAMPPAHAALALVGLVAAIVTSLRSVIVTYDGWYSAIYMAEETRDAARTVPRAMVGCALLITGLYVLINLGFLHALRFADLAASKLPAADVAQMIAPGGGKTLVTLLSLLTVLGVINAIILYTPRIPFALGRDGLISARAAQIGADGNPRIALAVTAAASALLVLSGTLEQLIAIAAIIFVLNYVSAYAAVFVLRWRQPKAERPFKAWGYPWTTGVVLAGSLAFLGAAIADNLAIAGFAAVLIACAAPAYLLARPRKDEASPA